MNEPNQPKEIIRQRHGLTTFWLIYILANGLTAIFLFTYWRKDVEELIKIELSDQYCQVLIGLGILNALSAIFLLLWKKIGFHGIIISSIISLYFNLQMGAGIGPSMMSLIQIAILYLVLQLKKNGKSTWEWLT